MKQKIVFLAIGVIILAVAGYVLMGQGSPKKEPEELTKVSMALDWFPWSEHVGFFIAKEKGYFADEGLDVELRVPPDPASIIQTVGSGVDDFGINVKPDVLVARSAGIPVVSIMALIQHPLSAIMTLEDSGIESPKDLAGKKIGWTGVPQHERMMQTILGKNGLSLDDVEMVNVGFDLVPALIGKQVDALGMGFWAYESIVAEREGFPVKVLKVNEYGMPDFYELVVLTNEETIRDNPELVQKFVRAVKRGYEDAIQDPEGAVQILKKTNPEVDVEVERRSTELQIPLWKSANGFGWQEEQNWVQFAQWMKDNGWLSADVDARAAFTNRFVENLQ